MWRNQIELESVDADSWFQLRSMPSSHRSVNEPIAQWLDLQAFADHSNAERSPIDSIALITLAHPWFKR